MATSRVAQSLVKIPKRIPRGPTDILKALAGTVRHEPSQPHYQFGDDPFLLPRNDRDKLFYTLSLQSGRKTARYLLNKHPELFYRNDAEPKIEAFEPPEQFSQSMELDETDLRWCIDNHDMSNALIAFNVLKNNPQGLDGISKGLLHNLHEMTSYLNENDLLSPIDWERMHVDPDSSKDLIEKTWHKDGVSTELFGYLKSKSNIDAARAYCVQIMGFCRYNEHRDAWKLYEEMCEKNLDGHCEMFNALLRSIDTIEGSIETAWPKMEQLVDHMNKLGIQPNLGTFNAMLKSLNAYLVDKTNIERAFKLLNEMHAANVEPSLATYYHFVRLVRRHRRGQYLNLFENIMTDIERGLRSLSSAGKRLEPRDPDDVLFLRQAMIICLNDLANVKLAHRVHAIYEHNPALCGTSRNTNMYLNDYLRVVVAMEPLEVAFQLYKRYVPMTFVPSASAYDVLIDALELHDGTPEQIDMLAKDIIRFGLENKVKDHALLKKNETYASKLDDELKRILS